jgi:pimeloyl-ACP methyl ester carboxylesterase
MRSLAGRCFVLMLSALGASPTLAQSPALSRDEVTAAIGEMRRITSPNGIEELKAIQIGGITQWISIRGRSRDNPILLFLHGGPASTDMPVSWAFQTPWEDYFTVVQWDQRGAGKTYIANDPAKIGPTLDEERLVADTEALIQWLRATYDKPKVFLLGHSWGSILGLEVARRHPDYLYAYVGMGQIVNMIESETLGFEWVSREAAARHDGTAVAELRAIAPYPAADGTLTIDQLNVQRKWSVLYGGLTHGRTSFDYYGNAAQLSPDYTPADVAAVDKGSALSLPRLWPYMMKADFTALTELKCPIVIFNGRYDETTSAVLTAQWFEKVRAPSKKLVWFENSAHMIHVEEPGRVVVHLVNDVLPLARTGRGSN